MNIEKITKKIIEDDNNLKYTKNGINPIFTAYKESKILIIGQAPGLKTQEQGIPFKDKSGERLREWLGVDSDFFYNSKLISVLPLDFYYPGKGKNGDLPPRLECADKWHKLLISNMPNIELIILIGFYAQKYYLGNKVKKNLTETVKNYKIYLPKYIPLVHPSPLNFRWFNRNPWFEENISFLKQRVKEIIGGNK